MVHTREMVLIGVMAAVLCILGPVSLAIPISPVPISFTTFALFLAVYVLGCKRGTICYLIYLLLGMVGMPVFSGFSGGIGKLLGPTGGYLIGMIFTAAIAGLCIDRSDRFFVHVTGMVLGTVICYTFGTTWLARQAEMNFFAALSAGVIPFIPGDLIKMILAFFVGGTIRKRLRMEGLNG
ncbi:MAG: biotin transporter BioY [Lachnospiraceae bacterium]|nr:biotin transporter BioY [Lachnospiraceae bacterium]